MATLNAYAQLTLAELAKRTGNGNIITIAEVLTQTNPILADIPYRPCNMGQTHKITRRRSLPTGTFRQINQGITKEASQTIAVQEGVGMLEARSEVDIDLVNKQSNPQAFRSGEDMAFVEGLSQTAASALFYGNAAVDPEKFNGLATRLNSLSDSRVHDGGGSGNDLTSIYIVRWGPQSVYGIFPDNTPIGLQMRDIGEVDALDSNSRPYRALATLFKWDLGLAEQDTRAIRRIANIETAGSVNLFSDTMLLTALNAVRGLGNTVIYCNETIKTRMDIVAASKTNVSYTSSEVFGVPTTFFRGVPVHQCDAILNTEAAVA